jgi:rRNA maturation RNase YbeY
MSLDPIEATIFISIDRIRENAHQFKQLFIDELHRVIAHGLLHLIGYNDKTVKESNNMRAMENKVLSMRPLELQERRPKTH